MLLKDPASQFGETHVASLGQQTQVAEILSRHLIRSVRAERVTIEAWTRQAQASGMGEYQIETLVKMFRYYDRHGFWGNPHTLTSLLGCEPTKFERFIKRTMGQVTNG
jgi:hypothetical protein